MEEKDSGARTTCSACGEVNEADATFCKKCGKRIDGKTPCSACGTANETDATFCKKCGKRLSAPTASVQTAPAAKPATKVCPSCNKVNSATATFCLRCGRSLTDIAASTASSPSQNMGAAVQATAPTRSVRVVGGGYDTRKHVFSLLLTATVLIFVFLIRMQGDFLYGLFGDVYKELADETAVRAPFIFGAAMYAMTITAICVLSLLAIVNDILYFTGKFAPDWLNKAWAANAFLVYAGGITILQTVLNGSDVVNALEGTTLAGLLIGGALAVLYAFMHVQNSALLFDEQLLRVLSLCLLVCMWILAAIPQLSLKTKAEGVTISVGEGYMPLLLASFILDAEVSVGTFVAGQLFQVLFVAAVCGMIWLCLFEEETRLRHIVQSVSIFVFAFFHLILALTVRGKYLDFVTPEKTAGAVSGDAAASVSLSTAVPVVLLLLSAAHVVVGVIRHRNRAK